MSRRRPYPPSLDVHDVVGAHTPGCARWRDRPCDCKRRGPDAPRGERAPTGKARLAAVSEEDTPDLDDEEEEAA